MRLLQRLAHLVGRRVQAHRVEQSIIQQASSRPLRRRRVGSAADEHLAERTRVRAKSTSLSIGWSSDNSAIVAVTPRTNCRDVITQPDDASCATSVVF